MKSKTGTPQFCLFLFSIFFYSILFSQTLVRQNQPQHLLFNTLNTADDTNAGFVSSKTSVLTKQPAFLKVSLSIFDTTKKDRDGDGIVDSLDKCPDEKGVIQFDGCPVPDSDNDGIADDKDNCPTISGPAKYNGCPPPDKDGDKINDEDDKCPDIPGLARYNGCPVGDRDKDGVNDDDDKCINVPGTIDNAGCPEIKKGTKPSAKPRGKNKGL